MDLKTYIATERGRAVALAGRLGVSPSYLSQMANGKSPISPERCVDIWRETGGVVTREALRPDDWQRIWPELIEQPYKRRRDDLDVEQTDNIQAAHD